MNVVRKEGFSIMTQVIMVFQIVEMIVPKSAHDSYSDILVEISSGAGGQEAMLFANELFEMYEKYAFLRGWNFVVESIDKTDLGQLKK